ncbi:MAG: hypothetical protein KatS3mg060_3535 [Dehalococcoidia bacterium]|nr:MAG: hypothetical protein KatS3mg060_3535 [Dehalococcoidia bacterium]
MPERPPLRQGRKAERAKVGIELINERNTGRNIQLRDNLVGHPIEVLDERPEAVAVGGDQHPFALADGGRNALEPVRQETSFGVFQALGEWPFLGS